MSYVTQGAELPDRPIPKPFIALVEKLLELGDQNGPEVGRRMADEVFSSNGVLDHGSYQFVGSKAIAACRSNAKPGRQVVKRQHRVSKVYSHTAEGHDFVVLGETNIMFDNGAEVCGKFAGRAVIDESTIGTDPRLALWVLYIDMKPILEASVS